MKKTVLVADPEIFWRDLLTSLLDDEFFVSFANNYEESYNLLSDRNNSYDVLVSELRLDQSKSDNDAIRLFKLIDEMGLCTRCIVLADEISLPMMRKLFVSQDFEIEDAIRKARYKDDEDADIAFNIKTFREKVVTAAHKAEDIRNNDVQKPKEKKKLDIFFIMPFAPDYEPVFQYTKKVAENMGKVCRRADRNLKPGSNSIMEDIIFGIQNAEIVIAELGGNNPNVYFEIGISCAWQKKIVLVANKTGKENIPELLSGNRIIFYETKWGEEALFAKDLGESLVEKLSYDITPSNMSVDIDPSLCFIITSSNNDGHDTYDTLIKATIDKIGMKSVYLWDSIIWHKLDNVGGKLALIERKIREACNIIADLSWDDPIAFYLAGIAYGLNKKYKFLYREDQDPPFDIKDLSLLRHSKNTEIEREEARIVLCEIVQFLRQNCQQEFTQEAELRIDLRLKPSEEGENKKKPSKVKVFLNHATEDKLLVRQLYLELKKHPWIDPWIDEERLLPGQELSREIDKAMEQADAVLVCMSETSIKKKGYVQAEIRKAEEQQRLRPQDVIYMIPVLLESCKHLIPPSLQKLLWVDISDSAKIAYIIKSLETLRK